MTCSCGFTPPTHTHAEGCTVPQITVYPVGLLDALKRRRLKSWWRYMVYQATASTATSPKCSIRPCGTTDAGTGGRSAAR